MERSGHIPEGFSAARWTSHQDARVRYEALRLQLTIARERDRAVRTALEDEDPRVIRLGLATLQQDCPPQYAALVAQMAGNPQADPEVRLLAINALARLHDPAALATLLSITDGGRTFFGRQKLAPKTPAVLAALRALAHSWADEPRATAMLKRGAQSTDAEVRQASQHGGS
jgi:HEAT repeat protein